MNENWNFHNYIAIPLETCGRKHIGGTFPSADEIDGGEYIDAMLLVLSAIYGDLDKFPSFVERCNIYSGLSGNSIPQDIAIALFDDFENLIKYCEEDSK